MNRNPESPYRAKQTAHSFIIEDDQGRRILDCRDRQSAEQYVVLLNQAHQRGYKAGFRAARSS